MNEEMALIAALKTQHKNLVLSMFDEGILDDQFTQVQALEDESHFVNQVITVFCNDTERAITELNKNLSYQNVDFEKLYDSIHRLKGSSSSIGAQRFKFACMELHLASEYKHKDGCLRALNNMTREYLLLRSKFETLIELENRVSAIETRERYRGNHNAAST
ncbi:Hpt domain-containing protein [Cephalotus follicularis]|uniref:Histidine-containing phosphotransfer protein n=1 Tax=Cephalotus follicularis TaxID=3775 RepID=A0A1Q3BE60_CEPFO|nr:Hpt domain-containing protein [Cephalotus follicularis]